MNRQVLPPSATDPQIRDEWIGSLFRGERIGWAAAAGGDRAGQA
ncbi:hypothetical protein [Nocardia sp. NPDC047038]